MLFLFCNNLEREADILKPLASVEVVEKEEASFETEISEDDVVGEWKLRGQVLTRSPVRTYKATKDEFFICYFTSVNIFIPFSSPDM